MARHQYGAAAPGPVTPTSDDAPGQGCVIEGQGSANRPDCAPRGVETLRTRFTRRAWLAAFDLELARERHATHRRYLRSGLCCFALALLRLGGHA